MKRIIRSYAHEPWLAGAILITLTFGTIILRSVAGYAFPSYFLYIALALLAFLLFSQLDFLVLQSFSTLLYGFSVFLLTLPILIGEVTRGTIRWIQIGGFTLQPAEIARPFLILFIAQYLTREELTVRRFFVATALFMGPTFLILLAPSLGVSVLAAVGFVGVVLSLRFNKRLLITAVLMGLMLLPFSWFLLADYQKERVEALFSPSQDPQGIGYNSIQALITVGSGGWTGRGLGEGVQTQLYFLPERHTDFIFASVSEELGFVGAFFVIILLFFLLWRILSVVTRAKNYTARAYAAGVFLTLFAQIMVHIGMNMGLFPITGLPLPLVSLGGSSLLANMIMLGMVVSAKNRLTSGIL